MPRPVRAVASLVLAALLLSACTSAGGEDTATSSASPRTLTVLLADDWAAADAVVDAITDFEAEHDVRVVTRPAAFGQLEEFMFADRAGSREIDVSQWHAFAAGALDLAKPITTRFDAEYPADLFLPGAMEDVTWDDEVYGVPLDVNAMVMVVNTTLLDGLGFDLDDLATWEGVRTVAEAAAEREVRFTHLPVSTWSMNAWLRANGGRWFERDAAEGTRLLLDSMPVQQTFEFLGDLATDRLAYADEETDTDADAYPLFTAGSTLALASGTWDVARLLTEDVPFEWEVVPMPMGPSADGPGTVLGGSSLYITEQVDDAALAWEFMTHLVQPEYALRYARESGRLPARTDVLADPLFQTDEYRVAVESLPHATPMQLIVYPRILDITTAAIFDALHKVDEPSAAFAEAQRAGEEILEASEADT